MPVIFLPRLLVFFTCQPRSHAICKSPFDLQLIDFYEILFEKIFIPTFDLAVRMYEDLDDDQEMIPPYQFGLLMVDWTNPQKAAEA